MKGKGDPVNRNLFGAVVVGLLTIVVVSLFWTYSLKEDAGRLTVSMIEVKDSVSVLHRIIDSLRVQTPGLGEYMSTIQLHIAKLWFAAQASNWKLAKYEHDELEETIETAEALHAKRDSVNISAVLQSVRQTQLPLIEQAINKKSLHVFENAYSQTLAACNGCHRPAGYEFIHIITPTREPVANQQWKVDNQ
jgi:hypothetical protein